MRKVAIVAPHFTPSNLASVHRSRLWAQHLHEFGWQPIIVTTHWDYYEEALDWDLHALVPGHVRVVRTRAAPTRPVRVVGSVGVRAFAFHYRALSKLITGEGIDFVHITVPDHYSAMLGPAVHKRHGTPYGIDYIDPWIDAVEHDPWTKGWAAARVGNTLEPIAVRDASLITGVAPLYYEAVVERHPHLRAQAVTAAMPYGGSERDFDAVRDKPRPTFLFDPDDGLFHMLYAGAMLPKAYDVLERLCEALVLMSERAPNVAAKLRLHFVGCGKSPTDPEGYNVMPYAERFGLTHMIDEKPDRIGYVDVLNHLCRTSGNLIIGSTEPHYTPSKSFQSVQARRPLLALLHEQSTAARFLADTRAATVVTLTERALPEPARLATALERFVADPDYDEERVDFAAFEEFSARSSAQALAAALDETMARREVA